MKTTITMVTAFVLTLLLGIGIAVGEKYKQSPDKTAIIRGKVRAPVKVTYTLFDSQASIRIRFLAVADDVDITFNGLDGLNVTRHLPDTDPTDFVKGDEISYSVDFEKPAGISYISVRISGKFNGVKRATVQAIPVGKIRKTQIQKRATNIRTIKDGKRIHLLPAESD